MDSLFDSPEKVAPCQSQSENINGIPIFLLKMQKKGFAKFHKCVGYKTQHLVSYLNFASFASYIRQNNEFKINMTSPHL